MTRRYDGVIFDFDGVILDSAYDGFEWANMARREVANELGYSSHDMTTLRVLFETEGSVREFLKEVQENDIDLKDLQKWEQAVAASKVERVKNGEMELFNDAEIIQGLKQDELKLAAVSNAYLDALDKIVEHFKLDTYLDFWTAPRLENISSYPAKMKPQPDLIFEATEALGLEKPLMVGDSNSDIEAAKNAGIDSVYINRDGEENTNADYNIKSLRELKDILEF